MSRYLHPLLASCFLLPAVLFAAENVDAHRPADPPAATVVPLEMDEALVPSSLARKNAGGNWRVAGDEDPAPPAPPAPSRTPSAPLSTGSEASASPLLAEALAQEAEARRNKTPLSAEKSIALFRKVSEAEPANAEARYRLGLALARAGRWADAASTLEAALVLRPDSPAYLVDYGQVALRAGDARKALDACRRAVELAPLNARANNALGNAWLANGFWQQAVTCYENALRREPDQTRLMHNLARALLAGQRYKRAEDLLTEILRSEPHSAAVLNDRGNARRSQKKIQEAVADWKEALRQNPQYLLARHNLIQVFISDDPRFTDRFEALAHAQEAVKLTEQKDALCLMDLAEAWRANYDSARAVATARLAVALDPAYQERLRQLEQWARQGFVGDVKPPAVAKP